MTHFGKFVTGAGVLAALVVIVAGVWIWFQFFRDDAPPPVSIDSAVSSLSQSQAATTPAASSPATATDVPATTEPEAAQELEAAETTPADTSETPTAEPTAELEAQPTAESASATWSVVANGDSFVGYRVGEELASIGTTEGVGRTSNAAGTLTLDGATVTGANFEADLTSLESDDSRRDRALSEQALETSTYPTATFALTSPIDLGELPADGVTFTATATGDLTLHGVTRSVEIPLEAQFSDGLLVVVGSLEIQFADYEISPPSAPAVLSVNDFGTLELQLVFSQA